MDQRASCNDGIGFGCALRRHVGIAYIEDRADCELLLRIEGDARGFVNGCVFYAD